MQASERASQLAPVIAKQHGLALGHVYELALNGFSAYVTEGRLLESPDADKTINPKTIYFSKSAVMYDNVIGLLINKVYFESIFMQNYRFNPLEV
ncbi:MAG: hypothetical protein ACU88J_00430 [Gammaproteobacteria bacterium]